LTFFNIFSNIIEIKQKRLKIRKMELDNKAGGICVAKFVLVDDSKMARAALKELLEEAGHEVTGEGSNGAEGYDLYESHKPDAITLDVTMPVESGIMCLKKIIKNFPDAKAVMVIPAGKDDIAEEVKQIGAKAIMYKPYEKENALNTVNSLLA
jgi:two-component system chemotaxis response regulator CheY